MAHRGAGITRNDRRILALKNRHRGQLCVLVGNGPSVRIEDIEKLKDCVTFCCNRFYLAYEQHPEMTFRPTYTISADQTMMDDFGEEMEAKCESTLFLVSNETIRLPGDYVTFRWDDRSREPFRFSECVHHHVWMGGGSLFPAIQIAFHMGIRHFYLYGVDHSFTFEIDGDAEDAFRSAKGDDNHFLKNYRSGKDWSPPQTRHIEESFQSCDLFMRFHDGWIKNATRGGKLEVLERVCFDDTDFGTSPTSETGQTSLMPNADFTQWKGGVPEAWQIIGCKVRRAELRNEGHVVVEIPAATPDAKTHSHLHRHIEPGTAAEGGWLGIHISGKSSEKNALFAKLDITIDGKRQVIAANHPGNGQWAALAIETDLPPGTDLDSLHYTVGLRKEAARPALVSNAAIAVLPHLPGRHGAGVTFRGRTGTVRNVKVLVDGIIYSRQERGGVGRIFEEILSRLADDPASGIDTMLHLPGKVQRLPRKLAERDGLRHINAVGVKDVPKPVGDAINMLLRPAFAHVTATRLKEAEARIFHSTYYTPPPMPGLKTVVTAYDFIDEKTFVSMSGNPPGFVEQVHKSLESADAVVAISEATKEDVLRFTKTDESKIRVIHHGASDVFTDTDETVDDDVANLRKEYRIGGPYWLYVGRRNPYKNFNALLRAWKIFRDTHKIDTWLVVTGSYADLHKWEIEYLIAKGLERRVVLTGAVDDARLRALYHGAAAFVFPSLYEGFGIPILEAYACGAPCIVSGIPVFREVVGDDAALYFEPYNDESMADQMMKVLDGDTRRRLLQQGTERLKLFSWEKCAREHAKLYRELA